MSKYWFGVNRRWGWYPTSNDGLVVLVGMVISICSTVYIINSYSHSISDTLLGIFPFVSLIIAFTMLVATLTGVHPQFGKEHKNSNHYSPDQPKAYLFLAFLTLPAAIYYFIKEAYIDGAILILVFVLLLLVHHNLVGKHNVRG